MSQVVYNPSNLPLTGTYLADQIFTISELASGTYSLGVYDPVTKVTHNLVLSAEYQHYTSPKLKINYINSESVNSYTLQVSGAQKIPFEDFEGRGLDPNIVYYETWPNNWSGSIELGPHIAPEITISNYNSLALTNTGVVTGWGINYNNSLDIPHSLSGTIAIAAGIGHSVALTNTGSVTSWGNNNYNQLNVPHSLSGVVAIAAGHYHSLAITNTGSVTAWGRNQSGQTNIPSSLSGVVSVAAGAEHSLALTNLGTVSAWGNNTHGQLNVPPALSGVIAIAAGASFSLALTNTGIVTAWGNNTYGQTNVPVGLSGVVSIATGHEHSLALTNTSTITGWGRNNYGQLDILPSLSGLEIFAIAAGANSSLVLTNTGMITGWGRNNTGQLNVPRSLKNSNLMFPYMSDNYTMNLYYDSDVSRWVLTTFRGVLVEQTDTCLSSVKPWEVKWSDLDTNSIKMMTILPLSSINNDGELSLTLTSNEAMLTSQRVIINLDNGTTVVGITGVRGTPIVFTNLNSELIQNNNLIITDEGKNRTWNLKLCMQVGKDASFIKYNNGACYQTGDVIIFPPNDAKNLPKSKIEYKNKIYKKGDILRLS